MNNELYTKCSEFFSKTVEQRKMTWNEFAKQNGFASGGEALRSVFKRERKKRGVLNKFTNNEVNNKIVCFDIETTPMTIIAWSLFDQINSPDQIISDSILLSWSSKYLNCPDVVGMVLTPTEAVENDDERIVTGLWNFLNGSNIIIGHNVKAFDLPYINARFAFYGFPALSYHSVIDTLIFAKKSFRFSSNSLKHINRYFSIKQKIENSGMSLWKNCINGDGQSLETMLEYCKGDVVAVEDLYYKIRPFIKGHPNLGLFSETNDSICPNCGSDNVVEEGFYYTTTGKFVSVRCKDCGAVSRKRTSTLSKEKKANLLRN